MSVKMLRLLEEPSVVKLSPETRWGAQKQVTAPLTGSSPTLAPLRSLHWKNFPDLLTSQPCLPFAYCYLDTECGS